MRTWLDRLDRYDYTNNWNLIINSRQFGGIPGELNLSIGAAEGGARVDIADARRFLPGTTLRPTETFDDRHTMTVGDTTIELRHARGETDDHLWAWLPDRKWIMAGDFVIWNFPNAGNPQKVQRYPIEWAAALREMIAVGPELLVPAHGLPIAGQARIALVLDEIATALGDPGRRGHRDDEPGGHARHDHPHGRGARRHTGQALPASVVRRAGVRDAQRLAPVRRMVGRRRIPAEAVARRPAGDGHRRARRRRRGADPAAPSKQSPTTTCGSRATSPISPAGPHPTIRRSTPVAAAVYLARRKAEPRLMSKGIFMAAARESQAISDSSAP